MYQLLTPVVLERGCSLAGRWVECSIQLALDLRAADLVCGRSGRCIWLGSSLARLDRFVRCTGRRLLGHDDKVAFLVLVAVGRCCRR